MFRRADQYEIGIAVVFVLKGKSVLIVRSCANPPPPVDAMEEAWSRIICPARTSTLPAGAAMEVAGRNQASRHFQRARSGNLRCRPRPR